MCEINLTYYGLTERKRGESLCEAKQQNTTFYFLIPRLHALKYSELRLLQMLFCYKYYYYILYNNITFQHPLMVPCGVF